MTNQHKPMDQILQEVMADLKKLTPEELKAEMEKAKDSDWYRMFKQMEEDGCPLYFGPVPADKECPDGPPA